MFSFILHVHCTSLSETRRKALIFHMTITSLQLSLHISWHKVSRRVMEWLHRACLGKEASRDRSPWCNCDMLPAQGLALSTPAHTQLERHTDNSKEAMFYQNQQLELSDCWVHCCYAFRGLEDR